MLGLVVRFGSRFQAWFIGENNGACTSGMLPK
jgi:hypothetical protein